MLTGLGEGLLIGARIGMLVLWCYIGTVAVAVGVTVARLVEGLYRR